MDKKTNDIIDFTDVEEIINAYGGTDKKKTLIYNDKKYLVKFPNPMIAKKQDLTYIYNAISEYVGSNIFKIVGFEVQNTILGTYSYNEKEKIVCACEDFTSEDEILSEFESLVLSIDTDKKIYTNILDVMLVIQQIQNMEHIIIKDNIKEKFWDMFVIDALIGNTDSHNGNWGLLVNRKNKQAKFSPIYDCGSCLNPMLEDA